MTIRHKAGPYRLSVLRSRNGVCITILSQLYYGHSAFGNDMRTLERVSISGFNSIREQVLPLKLLNILLGPNGADKSNIGCTQPSRLRMP